MELYIPVDSIMDIGALTLCVIGGFLVGSWFGARRERKGWLRFIEAQCRMSLTRTPDDPVKEMLKEREAARDRRLSRKDER